MTCFVLNIKSARCFILLAAALLFFAGHGSAQSLIRTAAQEASSPKFIAIVQDGKPAVGGICIDIMRAIEAVEPGIKFVGDQNWLPLVRITSGPMDAICGVLHTKERALLFDYIETPIFSVNYLLAVRADDDVQVTSWDDIRKLGKDGIILSIHNYAINDRLKDLGGLLVDSSAVSSKSNLNKLLARRGRFYCHRSPGILAEIRHAGMEGQVKLLPKVMLKDEFYMLLSKTLASEDARKVKAAIALLDRQGTLAKLFEKYQE
ncbi:MAG: transporter substrate-binding domain-containing protein [Burkholderiales bacterium]|nr:transporter substrate-binding domain-containing protein [Burkholderiales bacterium]